MEGRQLLSGDITATINETTNSAYGPTDILEVSGVSADEAFHLTQSGANLAVQGVSIAMTWTSLFGVTTGKVSQVNTFSQVKEVVISTGSGNDSVMIDPSVTVPVVVFAGSGTDNLDTGASNDFIFAGTGADTIVSIGGTHNTIWGSTATSSQPDSFWTDSGASLYGVTSSERADGMVHFINSFATLSYANAQGHLASYQPTMSLNGQALPDPLANINVSGTTGKSFAGDSLFAPGGPSPADIAQGAVGDCQFLASLLGLATKDPQVISNMIVSLGDGTYAVQFSPLGVDKYVRVNADLPVNASGSPVYAQLGQDNCLWVALLEKAWTFERPTGGTWWTDYVGTYHNIDGGGPGEIITDLDIPATNLSTANTFNSIVSAVDAGQIVVACTDASPTSTSGLVGAHCYYVDHINYVYVSTPFVRLAIPVSLTLRNPWGGANTWVTVSASDINASVSSAMSTPG